jgi:hypothetical protein
LDEKREILTALGQNFSVKDKEVHITANEWFVPIEKAYPELEAEFKRVELDKTLTVSMRSEYFSQLILSWGRGRNGPITPPKHSRHHVILNTEKGQSPYDLITIMLDEGYMQILREKLRLISEKKKELNLA